MTYSCLVTDFKATGHSESGQPEDFISTNLKKRFVINDLGDGIEVISFATQFKEGVYEYDVVERTQERLVAQARTPLLLQTISISQTATPVTATLEISGSFGVNRWLLACGAGA